ncbi:hypothetical protein LTR02_011404 [Friedmanniomyces endolithicus]|nr:hypothetical protein LTR94_015567 [Friedmanniomyces endolithicus]KAK0782483.1 hypothetical protein LTR38_013348 [Friedmanniomyces endolithicus]KAK0793213.1 hypothetical protein LTR75_011253 [Friedmanniomyces endolithicus]KAK0854244.1 hypothetical protein LTS02_011610 [Friedmanniomyces endolithicus]KAK0896098.1 hypothetical protein LTR02_011404 [Friedmanniomyces endolithicus]
MHFVKIIVAIAATLLSTPACSGFSWFTTSVSHAASTQNPIPVKALLARTDPNAEFEYLRHEAEKLNKIPSTSDRVLHRHFSGSLNVTAVVYITDSDAAKLFCRLEGELRRVSALPLVKVPEGLTVRLLPDLQAYYAEAALKSQGADGYMYAEAALLLSAAEHYHLNQPSTAVDRAYEVVVSSWPELLQLREQCWAVILKHHMPTSTVVRIYELLEDIRDLANDMRISASSYHNSTILTTASAVQRAQNLATVVKRGYSNETKPVVQFLRAAMRRVGKQPPKGSAFGGDKRGDEQNRPSLLSDGLQYARQVIGLEQG